MATTETAVRTTEEWLAEFAAGWAEPTDADSFSDHFAPLISDEMRLVQPQLPTMVGKQAFREHFARPLFDLLSDIRGTVESWAIAGDVLFVELTIRGRLASRPVELRTVDKITIRNGIAVERVANFDPLPLLAAVAITPKAWPRFARLQFRQLIQTRKEGSP